MKRILSFLCCFVCLLISIRVCDVVRAETQDYIISSDGTIIKYVGNERDLVIPSEVDGQEIQAIHDEAFIVYPYPFAISGSEPEQGTYLSSVMLPSTIKRIGQGAFEGQSELISVILNEGLEKIEGGAFRDCESMQSIIIPSTVNNLGGTIFVGTNIESIYFRGKCPSSIGNTTFLNFSYGSYTEFENLSIYYPAEYADSYSKVMEWYPNINWIAENDTRASDEDIMSDEVKEHTQVAEEQQEVLPDDYGAVTGIIDAMPAYVGILDASVGNSEITDFSYDESFEEMTEATVAKPKLAAPQRILPAEQSGTIFDDAKDIMLRWTAVENATQYKVYIKDVTDVPSSDWNNSTTIAPSVYPEPDCVYVHDSFNIVDGNISLNVGSTADFIDGHTYKACVIASDGGIHYEDSEGPVFFFIVDSKAAAIKAFKPVLNPSDYFTAHTTSTITVSWNAPVSKQCGPYTLTGYDVILLATIGSSYVEYANATLPAEAVKFEQKLDNWVRVDGKVGIPQNDVNKHYILLICPRISLNGVDINNVDAAGVELIVYADGFKLAKPTNISVKKNGGSWGSLLADKPIEINWKYSKINQNAIDRFMIVVYEKGKEDSEPAYQRDINDTSSCYWIIPANSLEPNQEYVVSIVACQTVEGNGYVTGRYTESDATTIKVVGMKTQAVVEDKTEKDTDDSSVYLQYSSSATESDLAAIKGKGEREEALCTVMDKWFGDDFDNCAEDSVIVCFVEGYGDHPGDAETNARSSALCVVYINGEIAWSAANCSTFPDQPFEPKTNRWDDVPTLIDGRYAIKAWNHLAEDSSQNYPCLKVGAGDNVAVCRINGTDKYSCYKNFSNGINIHAKSTETIGYNSAGCLIVGVANNKVNGKTAISSTNNYYRFAEVIGFANKDNEGILKLYSGASHKSLNYENAWVVVDRAYAYENSDAFKARFDKCYTYNGVKNTKAIDMILGRIFGEVNSVGREITMTKAESDALYNAYNINDHGITVADIQKFLETVGSADSPLVKKYPGINYDESGRHLRSGGSGWTDEAEDKLLGENFNNLTPAEMIYYAAKMNDCNVVYLLATLQKEEGLIDYSRNEYTMQTRVTKSANCGSRSGFLQQILNCTNQMNLFQYQYQYSFEKAYDEYTRESDPLNEDATYDKFMSNYYLKYAAIMDEILK